MDLERQVTSLSHAVDELGRLARNTRDRLQSVEAELRALRARAGGGNDVDGWGPRFAAIYADFTEHFRGSTVEVSAKLEGYLPDVQRLAGQGGVVDLGCGRGEWLTLLRAVGVAARGVDANPAFVAAGRARGLDMELGDALGYLRTMFVPTSGPVPDAILAVQTNQRMVVLAGATLLFLMPADLVLGRLIETFDRRPATLLRGAVLFVSAPYAALVVAAGTFSPFLYYQF